MVLIFGGAYQGKLEYAKKNFDVKNICDCSQGDEPDFSADLIYGIEGFVLKCAREGRNAIEFFQGSEEAWKDSILIMTDTSQGVVPIDRAVRDFREMNGRLMLYLAGEADRVIRVFCGIGKDLKAE